MAPQKQEELPNLKDTEITNQTVMLGAFVPKTILQNRLSRKIRCLWKALRTRGVRGYRRRHRALVVDPNLVSWPPPVLQEVGGGDITRRPFSGSPELANGEKPKPCLFGLKEMRKRYPSYRSVPQTQVLDLSPETSSENLCIKSPSSKRVRR